jgi:hypothetical protein
MLSLWALAGCPKNVPTPVVIEPASRPVQSAADVVGAAGVAATVIGKLERMQPEGASGQGTAIVLDDGTAIYLSEEAPPPGWEWMIGTEVRVQGMLWEHPEGGFPAPKLLEAEAPMPADVSIMLETPPG